MSSVYCAACGLHCTFAYIEVDDIYCVTCGQRHVNEVITENERLREQVRRYQAINSPAWEDDHK